MSDQILRLDFATAPPFYVEVDTSYLRFYFSEGIWNPQPREKAIHFRSVRSVDVRRVEPVFGSPHGQLTFVFVGAGISAEDRQRLCGPFVLRPDEQYNAALQLKKRIETALAFKKPHVGSDRPSQSSDTARSWPAKHFVADEIRKLKALMDEGVVTPAEFEAKKKQLLNL